MRVTQSMYYKNLYAQNNSQLNSKLFDVNKQIASGLKIQYAQDDVLTFADTMRLDNEITALGQIKKSTESGQKVSNQTDSILNDFTTTLTRTKTLLIQASNDTQSETSRNAIAVELRGLEEHFKNLANTSINGQFIFAGSATDRKPISADGTYMGNAESMKAFLGSGVEQDYNLSGAELFLGEESLVQREVITNIAQYNLSEKYPDFADPNSFDEGVDRIIKPEDSIRDLMGSISDTENSTSHFYIRGTKSSGEAFSEHIKMNDSGTVDELLTQIGQAFGNTSDLDLVNVSLDPQGSIMIQDKIKGSSKLDFHMVGAVDYNNDDLGDGADIEDQRYGINIGKIDNLSVGETDFSKIIKGTSTANNNMLHVKKFVQSSYDIPSSSQSLITPLNYDRTMFSRSDSTLSSSTSHVLKTDNAFATNSTKISEVADLSQGTAGTLDGTQFTLEGNTVNGVQYTASINFRSAANGGSTFSPDGGVTQYNLYNASSPRTAVDADEMTYKQVMDVMNMIVTDNLPTSTSSDTAYDSAVEQSTLSGNTYLSNDGKITFSDLQNAQTKANISMYDSNSGNFSGTSHSSVLTFNTNNALTISDPKTDFFKSLDEIITAVEENKIHPDGANGNHSRSIGISNALTMVNDLSDHVNRSQSKVGANSNALSTSLQRTTLLEVSTKTLRSSVVEVDLAEASLQLTQLSLNYEAMLSTVGKISKLSLVNYL